MVPETAQDVSTGRAEATTPSAPKIRWDDTHMQSAYANVCNVASTRKEVVLLFGVNQAWQASQPQIPIQLNAES